MSTPYPAAGSSSPVKWSERPYGPADALLGWAGCFLFAQFFGLIVLTVGGFTDPDDAKAAPIAWTLGSGLGIWVAFAIYAVWVGNHKGSGWLREFHVSIKAVDVPLGLVAGLVAQFVMVPLISYPVLKLTGENADDLARSANELADKVHGAGDALFFLLVVGIIAPLAEELFFRGLLFRAIERRFGAWWALGISSAFFGLTHFKPIEFVALTAAGAVFGYLMMRTGRLGPAIVAHMAFNISTVVVLLWLS